MNKKNILLTVVLCMMCGVTGCGGDKAASAQAAAKPVKASAVMQENVSSGYSYLGIVKAKETKNYSFLAAGKIDEICVEKGQQIKKGDVLAKLDTTSMEYQSSISGNTKSTAEATLQKTISTYDTNISNAKSQINTLDTAIAAGEKGIAALETGLKAESENIAAGETALATLADQLDAARQINAVGGYPDKDLDQLESTYKTKAAELEAAKATHTGNQATLETKKAELEAQRAKKSEAQQSLDNLYTSKSKDVAAAQAAVKSAGTSKSIVDKNINDATVVADRDGYVMELPYKEGEVIAAGYPVVVAKSKELVVTVGASDKEYPNISLGQKAIINDKVQGNVTTIAQYPDESTRTYAIDITVPEDAFTIGETVNVKIVTGDSAASYVPINAVFNIDGVDYVYIVNSENRLERKQVTKGDILNDKVRIEIDDSAAIVVTDGVKNLKENDLVKVEA